MGDVGLGVSRSAAYHKELSVTLSRSYGPGRYDAQYEEGGIDYPIGYVRWTEKRNMEAFLGLLASGAIQVAPLIERRRGVDDGARAYSELKENGAYTVLIEYPAFSQTQAAPSVERKAAPHLLITKDLQIGCIGAGSFARNVIFPAMKNCKGVSLHSVATASGVAAESARRSFGFSQAQSPADLLQDERIGAVFVISRHDSHARYVNAALAHHKPVFVEKPLAIDRKQLEEVCSTVAAEEERGYSPFLMVGFNRRFAPMTTQVQRFFADRREPMMIHIRVNAGFISGEHWTQQKEDGGRIVGEVCHFVDWARSVVGASIRSVTANALPDHSRYNRDNLVATLSFADGSLANLIYVANGDKSVPKEYFELFCEGGIARLDDFCSLELSRNSKMKRTKGMRDKGHKQEIQLTLDAIRGGTAAPIPFREVIEVSEATLAIAESITKGQAVSLQGVEVNLESSLQSANMARG